MNNKTCKRIIGLFIFALTVFTLGITNVYADAECDKVVKKLNTQATTNDRYGLTMNYDIESSSYRIKINPGKDTINELKKYDKNFTANKIKFKIDKIYAYNPGDPTTNFIDENGVVNLDKMPKDADISQFHTNYIGKVINNGDTFTIPRNSLVKRTNGLAIKLVPSGWNDPELVSACKEGKPSFYAVVNVEVEIGNDMTFEVETIGGDTSTSNLDGIKKIDCSKPQEKDSFEYNFCKDKNEALSKSSTRKFIIKEYIPGNMIKYVDKNGELGDKYSPGDALKFKCNYKDLVSGIPEKDEDYYINREFLYGQGILTIKADQDYVYTGEYSKSGLNLTPTCKLNCEEVVKVEYGPPVAKKAGMCFEYKVKVTSRVNCELKEKPTPPPNQVVCPPTPYCWHPGGYVYSIGGPNEDFDNCVYECDGGKYTDKCAKKCYREVYGMSITSKTTGDEISYYDVKKVAKTKPGLKYYISNGVIVWGPVGSTRREADGSVVSTAGGHHVPTDSYWHLNNTWGSSQSVYSEYVRGIPRKSTCQGTCSWKYNASAGCSNSANARYLNPTSVTDQYKNDKDKNALVYANIVAKCSAYASCNTTTTDFTISVNYTQKNGTTHTIDFPYSTNNNKDTIKSDTHSGNPAQCLPSKDEGSVVLQSDGCYNCKSINSQKMYMTEWSFPGTWLNNKSGDISYKEITGQYWSKYDNYFCLPEDVKSVNEKWYNYYYGQKYGSDTSYSVNNISYIKSIECPDGTKPSTTCNISSSTFTERDEPSIKYNINAKTRGFGMYEWDIDIACFYAVNNEYLTDNDKVDDNCKIGCTGTEKQEMKIRTVDLDNLFPNKNGDALKTPNETGRTPGFNWSEYAEQTKKDPKYTSSPANYTKWIQAKGTSVYSDEYLDYEVILTKEIIGQLKQEVNNKLGKNYTNWQGNVEVDSVSNYESPLFRNGGILSSNSKYPQGNAIKCNNMKNYASTECEDFTKEVK